jgi:hypothetical protein
VVPQFWVEGRETLRLEPICSFYQLFQRNIRISLNSLPYLPSRWPWTAIRFAGSGAKEKAFMKRTIAVVSFVAGAVLMFTPRTIAQAGNEPNSQSAATSQSGIDQDVQMLRQDIRSRKKQIIAANLKLTDTEATKFWPVYDQYSAELSKLGDQRYALIKEYAKGFGTLTDDQALSLMKRSLSLDEQVAQLRSKYVPIINQVLPGTKTATFFQLERYINSLIDLQVAGELPVVQEQK